MAREVKVGGKKKKLRLGIGGVCDTPEKGLALGRVVSCVWVVERSTRKKGLWDILGSSVVKTLHCQCRGLGFDPWWGN